MSVDHQPFTDRRPQKQAVSWLSNGSNPAQAVTAALPAESDLPEQRPDVPTPKERIAGLLAEYPERMNTPLSVEHGRKIRESLLDEPETVAREVEISETDIRTIHETVSRDALPLVSAVVDLLETYEGYRDKMLRMTKGYAEDADEFLVDLGISFDPRYQKKTYAKLSALERQFIGGEYPNGGQQAGEFDEPVTVLFGLTASAYNRPGDPSSGYRPAVDHDRAIREAWSGDTSSVKRSLRYVLEDKLGLSSSDYAWWWQSEPHPGEGAAAGYSHSHPVVVLDAAAADVPADQITAETFRPPVAKHVEECEGAGWSAHDLDDAVTVRQPEEIDDFTSYVSKYLAVGPDRDLLERSDEYLLWAASQWATSTQKYSKSATATAAIDADKCQQQYLDPDTHQHRQHGEEVVRAPGHLRNRGIRYVCTECGSPHGIDQSEESLARMRLDAAETAAVRPVVTDGGSVVEAVADDCTDDDGTDVPQTLAERWPTATAAARVGEPVHEPGESVRPVRESFEREPQWRPDAIVQAWDDDGEGTPIGSPGGTRFGEVVVEGRGSIMDKCDLSRLPNVSEVEGPEPWKRTKLFTESQVRAGEIPPPELVAREWVETVQTGRRLTPKEWPADWYGRRYGDGRDRDDVSGGLALGELEEIEELVRVEGELSAVEVCGQLMIDPVKVKAVRGVIAGDDESEVVSGIRKSGKFRRHDS